MDFLINDNKFKKEITNGNLHKKYANWYFKLKGVRFNLNVEVYLIPSRYELDKEELWWSFEEIEYFRKIYYDTINDK